MNLRRWFRRERHELSRCSVALFGALADGSYRYGTGILVDLRGTPIILTCAHVMAGMLDPVHVVHGRAVRHYQSLYVARYSDQNLDWACLVLRDPADLPNKIFVPATDIVQRDVGTGEPVLLYGFPIGNSSLQVGAKIDRQRAEAHFRSMTYLSVTGVRMQNPRLGRVQPKAEWEPDRHFDSRTFTKLKADLSKYERGGFSGGPVFLANSRRLIGQITDASDYSMFFNPIDDVLTAVDRRL